MDIRSLGFRTDLRLLEMTGSVIEDRGTHLVVRTPDNPTYFWGNFLLLRQLPFPGGERTLAVYWLRGYAGGLFLPFRDATNGTATYGAGRYLVDAAKSADLGADDTTGELIIDANFAYQPSCAFDPRWACPLAPPENRLDLAVEAGERLA